MPIALARLFAVTSVLVAVVLGAPTAARSTVDAEPSVQQDACYSVGQGWVLLSVPVEPEDPDPDAVEINPQPAFSYLYRWDPETKRYLAAHRAEITELAKLHAYWLYLDRDVEDYEVCIAGTALTDDASLVLGPAGWQMIGVPYPVAWGEVSGGTLRVRDGAETKTLDEALDAGWVLGTLYAWDSAEGTWIRHRATDGATLVPWTGYFLYTTRDQLELLFQPPDQPISAAFSVDPNPAEVGETVTFDASESTGDIVLYTWAFGDGSTATGKTVQHTYASAGVFEAQLTVEDGHSVTDVTVSNVYIYPQLPPPPG